MAVILINNLQTTIYCFFPTLLLNDIAMKLISNQSYMHFLKKNQSYTHFLKKIQSYSDLFKIDILNKRDQPNNY